MALAVGTPAPDFTLPSHSGENVTLSSLKGKKHVILSFHVLTFTGA
jgi:peroxiredoxin